MSDDGIQAQGSQGLVYKPQGTVEQHFGDRIDINAGGGDLEGNGLSNGDSSLTTITEPISPNFFAYDDTWVGRESLIQDLSPRIRSSCRLLILVGITGIGKTALGERLAVELSDWFEGDWSKFHEENFENEQQSNDFSSVAARWLEKWGDRYLVEGVVEGDRCLRRQHNLIRSVSLERLKKLDDEDD